MMRRILLALGFVCALALVAPAYAQQYRLRVIASGLAKPTGIAVDDGLVYFTEVPQPGVAGGTNAVKQLNLWNRKIKTLHMGEPQPVNISVGRDGSIYWICLSAGVILKLDDDGVTTPFLRGLQRPSGISVSRKGVVYFTQVPTPGVAGSNNGVFASRDGVNIETINMGEPEPVDIVVAPNGDLYWTCRTAGVILMHSAKTGMISVLLSGLDKPTGIALDRHGRNLYFTEVPTPGVAGANGGRNRVSRYNLNRERLSVVNLGDPEPTDVAVASDGTVYWTCTSAGVIVEARRVRGKDDDPWEDD